MYVFLLMQLLIAYVLLPFSHQLFKCLLCNISMIAILFYFYPSIYSLLWIYVYTTILPFSTIFSNTNLHWHIVYLCFKICQQIGINYIIYDCTLYNIMWCKSNTPSSLLVWPLFTNADLIPIFSCRTLALAYSNVELERTAEIIQILNNLFQQIISYKG